MGHGDLPIKWFAIGIGLAFWRALNIFANYYYVGINIGFDVNFWVVVVLDK